MSEKVPGAQDGSKCGCGCGPATGGKGPAGVCICAACGHQVPHEPGVPCREAKCPRCGGAMNRGTG